MLHMTRKFPTVQFVIQDWTVCRASRESQKVVTDGLWHRIKDWHPYKMTDRRPMGGDDRMFVDAMWWIARTDAPCG